METRLITSPAAILAASTDGEGRDIGNYYSCGGHARRLEARRHGRVCGKEGGQEQQSVRGRRHVVPPSGLVDSDSFGLATLARRPLGHALTLPPVAAAGLIPTPCEVVARRREGPLFSCLLGGGVQGKRVNAFCYLSSEFRVRWRSLSWLPPHANSHARQPRERSPKTLIVMRRNLASHARFPRSCPQTPNPFTPGSHGEGGEWWSRTRGA